MTYGSQVRIVDMIRCSAWNTTVITCFTHIIIGVVCDESITSAYFDGKVIYWLVFKKAESDLRVTELHFFNQKLHAR